MNKLMFQGFWNSLLLTLTFLYWTIQNLKSQSIVWLIVGVAATGFVAYDTYQFYKAMKENN